MKKVFGVLKRTGQRFNIDNRAQRLLDKQKNKAEPSPKHPDSLRAEYRTAYEDTAASKNGDDGQEQKDRGLVDRMNRLSVQALDEPIEIRSSVPAGSRASRLPESRQSVSMPEFGYVQPEHVSPGRISLSQALAFISARMEKPGEYPASRLAQETGLAEAEARHVLRHFQMLSVRVQSGEQPDPVALSGAKTKAIEEGTDPTKA